MKYILCQNSKHGGKYYKGRQCNDKILVDDNAASAICWKCVALLVPPEEKKISSGYPRGWKFMAEFVDKDGNVYHKGELQNDLFGTLQPTEVKESKKRERKKDTLDDKIIEEFKKRVSIKTQKKSPKKVTKVTKVKVSKVEKVKKTKPKK